MAKAFKRLLGLDFGSRFIGVAVADTDVKIAYPLPAVAVNGQEITAIKQLVTDNLITDLVVGLPRNQSGQETAQSALARDFSQQLTVLGLPVHLQDESLTSVVAEERLKSRGGKFSKSQVDSEAATIILSDFLEA